MLQWTDIQAMHVRPFTLGLLAATSLVVLPAGAEARSGHHLARPHGGRVTHAWPAAHRGRPSSPLARWLAKQVGPAPKVKHARHAGHHKRLAARMASAAPVVPFANTGIGTGTLALVRSYEIPADDPAASRMANLSWTYDSAISAVAFAENGFTTQAQQLLSQLAALQRTDGSIDFAYNTANGQSIAEFRTGTIAWVGLAAVDYHALTCSTAYDALAAGAARYLLTLQRSNGLMVGGPDVTWSSTQHNLVARAFLARLADLIQNKTINGNGNGNGNGGVGNGKGNGNNSTAPGQERYAGCSGQSSAFGGMTASQSTAFVTQLRAAVTAMDTGISSNLFVRLTPAQGSSAGTAYFREGVGDDLRPADAQALGIMWLLGQGRTSDAQAVLNYANATMLKSSFSVADSSNPLTYNETYASTGPFSGYTPYDTSNAPGTPDVMWMEGTLEMRYATNELAASVSGLSTSALDTSILAYDAITGLTTGPLQANGAVTGNVFNEYHPWPASAPAAWTLINLTGFSLLSGS